MNLECGPGPNRFLYHIEFSLILGSLSVVILVSSSIGPATGFLGSLMDNWVFQLQYDQMENILGILGLATAIWVEIRLKYLHSNHAHFALPPEGNCRVAIGWAIIANVLMRRLFNQDSSMYAVPRISSPILLAYLMTARSGTKSPLVIAAFNLLIMVFIFLAHLKQNPFATFLTCMSNIIWLSFIVPSFLSFQYLWIIRASHIDPPSAAAEALEVVRQTEQEMKSFDFKRPFFMDADSVTSMMLGGDLVESERQALQLSCLSGNNETQTSMIASVAPMFNTMNHNFESALKSLRERRWGEVIAMHSASIGDRHGISCAAAHLGLPVFERRIVPVKSVQLRGPDVKPQEGEGGIADSPEYTARATSSDDAEGFAAELDRWLTAAHPDGLPRETFVRLLKRQLSQYRTVESVRRGPLRWFRHLRRFELALAFPAYKVARINYEEGTKNILPFLSTTFEFVNQNITSILLPWAMLANGLSWISVYISNLQMANTPLFIVSCVVSILSVIAFASWFIGQIVIDRFGKNKDQPVPSLFRYRQLFAPYLMKWTAMLASAAWAGAWHVDNIDGSPAVLSPFLLISGIVATNVNCIKSSILTLLFSLCFFGVLDSWNPDLGPFSRLTEGAFHTLIISLLFRSIEPLLTWAVVLGLCRLAIYITFANSIAPYARFLSFMNRVNSP